MYIWSDRFKIAFHLIVVVNSVSDNENLDSLSVPVLKSAVLSLLCNLSLIYTYFGV